MSITQPGPHHREEVEAAERMLLDICKNDSGDGHFQKLLTLAGDIRDGTFVVPSKLYRTLNDTLLQIATSGNNAVIAAAALVNVSSLKVASRSFDALVFETMVRKMVAICSNSKSDLSSGRSYVTGKRKQRGYRIEQDGIEGDEAFSDGHPDKNEVEELLKTTAAAFWKEIVVLIEQTTLGQVSESFVSSVSMGLAGLLRSSSSCEQYAIVQTGFISLSLSEKHGVHKQILNVVFAALLPLAVMPRLNSKTRTALTEIIKHVVIAEKNVIAKQNQNPVAANRSRASREAPVGNSEVGSSLVTDNQARYEHAVEGSDNSDSTRRQITPEPVQEKLISFAFLQTCCVRAPERADDRLGLCTCILEVLKILDISHTKSFISFLLRLSRQSKSLLRLLANEVMLGILSDIKSLPCHLLLEGTRLFIERSSDKVPAVRAKAISCISVTIRNSHVNRDYGILLREVEKFVLEQSFDLERRGNDSKSGVRKAVVQLTGNLALALIQSRDDYLCNRTARDTAPSKEVSARQWETAQSPEDGWAISRYTAVAKLLEHIRPRCEDIVPTIRRLALQTYSQVIQVACASDGSMSRLFPESRIQSLSELWLECIFPRIVDQENLVQDAAIVCIQDVLIEPVHGNSSTESNSVASGCQKNRMLSNFLKAMSDDSSAIPMYASRAICILFRKDQLGADFVNYLQDIALSRYPSDATHKTKEETENARICDGAWALLVAVITADCKNKCLASLSYRKILEAVENGIGGRYACQALACLSGKIPEKEKRVVGLQIQKILTNICSNSGRLLGLDAIPSLARTLASLIPEQGDDLLSVCDNWLSDRELREDEDYIIDLLAVVGEVCISFTLDKEPSAKLMYRVQALISREQSHRVRAMAIATMGKLCLVELTTSNMRLDDLRYSTYDGRRPERARFGETLARRSVSLFIRELHDGDSVAARINALIVLSDLCRRYTSVVEPHIDRLAMCLRDQSQAVRKRALASLTSLLQEDYLKTRGGPLYFRLLQCLLDNDDDIRRSVEYILAYVLFPKVPMLFCVNFVEVIFVANNYEGNKAYNQYLRSAEEAQANAQLTKTTEARFIIYTWLISHMPLEQKITLPSRLRHEILLPILEKTMNIEHTAVSEMARDALLLLATPELSLHPPMSFEKNGARQLSDERESNEVALLVPADEQQAVGARANGLAARTKAILLAQVYDIELREETVPMLLDLRTCFEHSHSPLLADIGNCLCSLLRPVRSDLHKYVADPTTRAEIEFDMRSSSGKGADSPHQNRRDEIVCASDENLNAKQNRSNANVTSRITRSGRTAATRLAEAIEASPKLLSVAKKIRSERVVDFELAEDEDDDLARHRLARKLVM